MRQPGEHRRTGRASDLDEELMILAVYQFGQRQIETGIAFLIL
jgi:hypothetical protein